MNHYQWLEMNLPIFFKNLELDYCSGIITAHGDKCYGYKDQWAEKGIHFFHGVAIFLLSYISPFNKEVRNTDNGWVPVVDWVINNYERFKPYLPKVME